MTTNPIDAFAEYLGNYRGDAGQGICPSGQLATYDETLNFRRKHSAVWLEFCAVEPSGQVLHEEHGVLRSLRDGRLEASIVMNSGRMEYATGRWDGSTLLLDSSRFFNDRLGVLATRRKYEFRPGACSRTLWLAAPGWPDLTRHMWGELQRVSQP